MATFFEALSGLFRPRREAQGLSAFGIDRRGKRTGSVTVTDETALRMSSVWAALVLRANLVSTFPIDVYRTFDGVQVEVPKPRVLVDPQGDGTSINDFMFASQFDLDRVGNSFGIITATDGAGNPAEVKLVDHSTVTVVVPKDGSDHYYKIDGKPYPKSQVWHERQYVVPGLVMGLSPLAYAAWSIGTYQSAQEFALEWFANGAQVPSGHFQNTEKILAPGEADVLKARFKAAVQDRDVIVTGNDWKYTTVNAASADTKFLDTQSSADVAVARYFGVPADLIDAAVSGQSVTYANIGQRNLQFLIMNLQPTLTRREVSLSKFVEAPRFVKLNTDALLRMDPATKAETLGKQVESLQITLTEARAIENRAPYTEAQWAELARTQGLKSRTGVAA